MTTTHTAHCAEHPSRILTCSDCGDVTYDGPDCGHVAQPCPVAASAHGDHGAVCTTCEAKRTAETA